MSGDSPAQSPDPASPGSTDRNRGAAVIVGWAARAVPLALIGLIAAIVIPGVAWYIGLLLGLVAAAVWTWTVVRSAASGLLGAIGAEPADEVTHAGYVNLVQGLSLAGGTGEPDIHVVDRPGRNAAAVARGETAALVVTTGLLQHVDRVALEAVVAEGLVRIENGDADASTLGAALFSPLMGGPLASLTAPIGRLGLSMLLGGERDLQADRAAVTLTRYPPGLQKALEAVREGRAAVEDVSPNLDHIWFVPPPSVIDTADTTPETAPLDLRIDVLGEL